RRSCRHHRWPRAARPSARALRRRRRHADPAKLKHAFVAVARLGGSGAMTHTIHDIGVARQIGLYSDCIEAGANLRWLMTAGTPGLAASGELPRDITGQSE